jgi:hypothetical protein
VSVHSNWLRRCTKVQRTGTAAGQRVAAGAAGGGEEEGPVASHACTYVSVVFQAVEVKTEGNCSFAHASPRISNSCAKTAMPATVPTALTSATKNHRSGCASTVCEEIRARGGSRGE